MQICSTKGPTQFYILKRKLWRVAREMLKNKSFLLQREFIKFSFKVWRIFFSPLLYCHREHGRKTWLYLWDILQGISDMRVVAKLAREPWKVVTQLKNFPCQKRFVFTLHCMWCLPLLFPTHHTCIDSRLPDYDREMINLYQFYHWETLRATWSSRVDDWWIIRDISVTWLPL